jgi:hypothetical protein
LTHSSVDSAGKKLKTASPSRTGSLGGKGKAKTNGGRIKNRTFTNKNNSLKYDL